MGTLFRRLWHLLRLSRHDAELREEIETHRSLRQGQLERHGLTSRDAAEVSRRVLGNVALAREDVRTGWTLRSVDGLRQDLGAVLRGLRKSPGFTLVAVGTLALGIGANSALFSVYNGLLLRTLPVKDPGSLALLGTGEWTYPIWQAVNRRSSELFDGAFAWSPDRFDLSPGGETAFVDGAYMSGRLFDVLGIRPAHGRLLASADDDINRGAVVVISHRFWQQRFGGAQDVVGRTVALQRVPFTIVGVMPEGFFGPDVGRVADVMIPFGAEPLIRGNSSFLTGHWTWWVEIMARLRPGQTLEQATAALRAVQPQLRAESLPEGTPSMLERYMTEPLMLLPAATGRSDLRGRFETPLVAMLAVVGLVLLVACANIANLLLARALTRRHELSVRLALGASRWRLARLLLAESLVVAATGAAAGLVFASWSSALLVRQLGTWRETISLDMRLDWRVLGFTAALACLTAIVAGVAPALGVKRVAPNEALKDSGRGIAGDRRFAIRGTLLIAQIAVSLVLVVAAGLFLRTFTSLSRVPLGFQPDRLIIASLNLQSRASAAGEAAPLVERMRAAAAATPGVTSAAVSTITPISGSGWNAGVGERSAGPPDRTRMTWMNAVSPGWFQTMGLRVVSGRDFDTGDVPDGTPVAIVNEAFVRRFLADRAPLGARVLAGGPRDRTDYHIVGVVSDAVYRSAREGAVPTLFMPETQSDSPATSLTIATAPGQRDAAQRALASSMRQVDPSVAFTLRTFDEYVHASMLQERVVALLSTFFGALSLLLAALGLYGVVSHAVNARRTEISLRIALGASASSIMRLVFKRVGLLLAIGLVCGLSLSLWASPLVQTFLFRLDARDPVTFTSAVVVLTAAVVLAAWLPARRAARLEPARLLREG
ncbi:MAG: ABC transporter permease [Vicinamibacterales bacterium]